MKVSIITVCYNSRSTIADALRSVAAQSWPQIEYIVIDGGSTDGTVELVRELAPAGAVVVSEPDRGIYDAMNKGLRLASGDMIGFLNADDVLAHADVIAEIAKLAEREEADVVYGDLVYVARDRAQHVVRRWQSGRYRRARLGFGWMPPHPTFYFRRGLLPRLQGFNIQFRIAADYDFMLRCLLQPGLRISYLPQVLVKMKTGGASNRSLRAIFRKSVEDYSVLRQNRIGGFATLIFKNIRKLPQLIG